MNKEFWKNKKVLITGHTGFKGSWMSLWLQSLGAKVIGVALDPPTDPSLYVQAKIFSRMTSLREDIRDLDAIAKIFRLYEPNIVFHFAAQSLVRYSYSNPVETYQTNVLGTLNILEGIRKTSTVRAGIFVTSDKCYENKEWPWGYREIDPVGGYDLYSSSKGCCEILISSYRKSYFPLKSFDQDKVAIATVRAGNVIGGGDWALDRIVPDIIRAYATKNAVQIRNKDAIRPWQHVLEPLSGYLKLAEYLHIAGASYSEAWNFGPNDSDVKSVQWLVEKLGEIWGDNLSWIVDESKTHHEAGILKLDCSKAHDKLAWWPRWNLTETLEKIVEWYQASLDGADMKNVSLKQIEDYMNMRDESK